MSINFEIEVYEENNENYVFLSHEGSSGCKYKFTDVSELKDIVGQYIADAYLEEQTNTDDSVKLEILDVGVAMDELSIENDVITGIATVYSRDLADSCTYEDDFRFVYNKQTQSLVVELDGIFNDYINEIKDTLLDNLQTNLK